MVSLIRDRAASTPELLQVFGDEGLVRAALDFERELARAQAAEGLLTADDAAAIAEACAALPDIADLAEQAAHAGTLAIPLVAELRARLADRPATAAKVHLGATSQDVADTSLVLQARAGLALLRRDSAQLTQALRELAHAHAETPMLGRTLLQPAKPITFGLKLAGWLLGVEGALERLSREADAALFLQFGGPAGSLDGLGGKALPVAKRLAAALDLRVPPAPWHARREGIAGLAAALAILTGALGKMAGDIGLLAQPEIGEVFEPKVAGRGGSSAMAYKRNPTGCQVARSAALRAPHLAATILSALPQEHERGLGGWQAEAPVLAELFCVTHGALAAMAAVVAELEVHADRMLANLRASGLGDDLGEAPALTLRALQARSVTP
jgi:3-carboxy-cis,cis-muconate cycloisomerase